MESTNEKKILDVAEFQLSYKSSVKPSMRPKTIGSRDAHNVLRQYWDTDKLELVEQFKVMLLDIANEVIGLLDLSTGTIADPRPILCTALKGNACGIIVAHNHPSGNLSECQADIAETSDPRRRIPQSCYCGMGDQRSNLSYQPGSVLFRKLL